MVSAAWAGTGSAPIDPPETTDATDVAEQDATDAVNDSAASTGTSTADPGLVVASPTTAEDPDRFHAVGSLALPTGSLEPGWYHVGAATVSLYPNPEAYQDGFPGAQWVRDHDACATLPPDSFEDVAHASHLGVAGSPWNENPNCIYMGGYGIGPMFPIVEFDDEYGLWVRSLAGHRLDRGVDPPLGRRDAAGTPRGGRGQRA